MKNITNQGQIWIETVLYTLIGLALIALVLAFVMPRINDSKDQLAVRQSIDSLTEIDNVIRNIWTSPGNQRPITVTLRRGQFSIDSQNDTISIYISDLTKPFSQPNVTISFGSVKILSETGEKYSTVLLSLNYSGQINITYKGNDELVPRNFAPAPTPYNLLFVSKGSINQNSLNVLDIQ